MSVTISDNTGVLTDAISINSATIQIAAAAGANSTVNTYSIVVQNTSSKMTVNTSQITFPDTTYVNSVSTTGSVLATAPTNTQTFTASGTWVKPSSGKFVVVRLWGGGGSGGARRSPDGLNPGGGSGGGGGAFHESLFNIACLTANVTVTVGAGGAGVSTNSALSPSLANGKPGGTTSFGSYLSAYGGSGGPATCTSLGGTVYGGGSGSAGACGGAAANSIVVYSPVIATGISPTGNSTAVVSKAAFITIIANPKNDAAKKYTTCGSPKYAGGWGGYTSFSSTYGGGKGGNTTFGGGGGGGSYCGASAASIVGGVSIYGGNGTSGTYGFNNTATTNTAFTPAGGSGGAFTRANTSFSAVTGSGGCGRAIVYVY